MIFYNQERKYITKGLSRQYLYEEKALTQLAIPRFDLFLVFWLNKVMNQMLV